MEGSLFIRLAKFVFFSTFPVVIHHLYGYCRIKVSSHLFSYDFLNRLIPYDANGAVLFFVVGSRYCYLWLRALKRNKDLKLEEVLCLATHRHTLLS